ncbi:hypothetical protein ABE527_17720, partial [Brucella sp. TWI432]
STLLFSAGPKLPAFVVKALIKKSLHLKSPENLLYMKNISKLSVVGGQRNFNLRSYTAASMMLIYADLSPEKSG